MKSFSFLVSITLISLATANPQHLQQLYGGAPADNSQHDVHQGSHDNSRFGVPLALPNEGQASFNQGNFQQGSSVNDILASVSDASSSNFNNPPPISSSNVGGLYQAPEQIALQSQVVPVQLENFAPGNANPDITVTSVSTYDVFQTSTNLFYNTIPVTLTEFARSTVVAPTFRVETTPVNDIVVASTVPYTKTDTVTVTDINTVHQFVTDVSTDFYTITHKAYDIQQQLVSSTVVQTEIFRPTIVSTVVLSEYDTSYVTFTVTNTVVLSAPKQTYGAPAAHGSGFRQPQQSGQGFGIFSNPSGLNSQSLDSINKATYDVVDVSLQNLLRRTRPESQIHKVLLSERNGLLNSSNLQPQQLQSYLEGLFNRLVGYTKQVENSQAGGSYVQ